MAVCPNKNDKNWKTLVGKIGIQQAYKEFIANNYEIPDPSNYEETFKGVNVTIKIIDALENIARNKYTKEKSEGFFNDLRKQGVNKQQLDLLKNYLSENNISEINKVDLISDLLSNTTYTIEINTTKTKSLDKYTDYGDVEDIEERFSNVEHNTQYYSNLTVPGGANGSYREVNIESPLIILPKSHAQFNTEHTLMFSRMDNAQNYTEKDVEKLLSLMEENGQLKIKCN